MQGRAGQGGEGRGRGGALLYHSNAWSHLSDTQLLLTSSSPVPPPPLPSLSQTIDNYGENNNICIIPGSAANFASTTSYVNTVSWQVVCGYSQSGSIAVAPFRAGNNVTRMLGEGRKYSRRDNASGGQAEG